MTVPNAEDILRLPLEDVSDFIITHRRAKTLSATVRRLNDELLNGDSQAHDRARGALEHLGFLEFA